ncbi:MAG: hypothetical protein AAGB02_07375 [Pseudomonadota bacterium]
MPQDAVFLTPFPATLVFIAGVLAGYQYRKNWKYGGPAWKLWIFGVTAAVCLALLAFIPLRFE